jgi:hypothetical protein
VYSINHDKQFLACEEHGWKWEYTTIWGSLFTLFHMMSILMQSIMTIKIFYWEPNKLDYFPKEDGTFFQLKSDDFRKV